MRTARLLGGEDGEHILSFVSRAELSRGAAHCPLFGRGLSLHGLPASPPRAPPDSYSVSLSDRPISVPEMGFSLATRLKAFAQHGKLGTCALEPIALLAGKPSFQSSGGRLMHGE
jgi:hypothetical protein